MAQSGTGSGIDSNQSVEEILDAIGDPYARDVLAFIGNESRSAREIAEALDHSINTVYRRVNLLQKHDLVESSLEIDEDGNHRQRFETTFDSVVISVGDNQYDVEIYRREELPDQFVSLWDDLSRN